jgi:DegV family protein with EDD domain
LEAAQPDHHCWLDSGLIELETIMGKIAIITDSNTCIPSEGLHGFDIHIVPIALIFGEETLRDGVDITAGEFYERLRHADPLPTTSSPAIADFLEVFQEARKAGAEGAVVVTISSKLSMSFSTAHAAAQDMQDFPVSIIDSRLATIAQGFVVLEAACAASKGLTLEEVTAVAEEAIPHIGFAAMLETLSFLQRGGRVPVIASLAGNALKLRPVVRMKADGTVGILSATRGRKAAIDRILREAEKATTGQKLKRMAVMHADARDEAEGLLKLVAERFETRELLLTEFTPVMGTHAGPGVLGLAYQVASVERSAQANG